MGGNDGTTNFLQCQSISAEVTAAGIYHYSIALSVGMEF